MRIICFDAGRFLVSKKIVWRTNHHASQFTVTFMSSCDGVTPSQLLINVTVSHHGKLVRGLLRDNSYNRDIFILAIGHLDVPLCMHIFMLTDHDLKATTKVIYASI